MNIKFRRFFFSVRLLFAILILALFFGRPNPARAQIGDGKEVVTRDLSDLVHGIAAAKAFELTIYPTYAPKLAHQWGAGAALLYPIGEHAFTGLRADFLDGNYFAASASVGARTDVILFGHTFTPFALTGVVVPIAKAGAETGQPGAIVGAGMSTLLWQNASKSARVSAFAEAEYWSQYSGVQIYHAGAQLSFRW